MITDKQARAVIESMRNAWSGHTPAEVDTLLAWARQELSRRDRPDDGMMTPEEAERAYDEAEAVPISSERIAEVVKYVRDRSDDGPITAEWCRENGGEELVGWPLLRWRVGPHFVFADPDGRVSVGGAASPFTRRQLLALLAALRGEPSENPGQLPAVGPQRAAPSSAAKIEAESRAARGQLNNFGGGR